MGDQGRLYVNEDVVPAYKALLKDADLILPNQFEAEYEPILHVLITLILLELFPIPRLLHYLPFIRPLLSYILRTEYHMS